MTEIAVASEPASPTDNTEPLSQAVVEAVARAEDADALDLAVPLYDAIDPDALDALFQPGDNSVGGYIAFDYYGYEVTVAADGSVSIDELAADR